MNFTLAGFPRKMRPSACNIMRIAVKRIGVSIAEIFAESRNLLKIVALPPLRPMRFFVKRALDPFGRPYKILFFYFEPKKKLRERPICVIKPREKIAHGNDRCLFFIKRVENGRKKFIYSYRFNSSRSVEKIFKRFPWDTETHGKIRRKVCFREKMKERAIGNRIYHSNAALRKNARQFNA